MALLIDNAIAEQALQMPAAIDAMESAWKQYAEGNATFQPRTDVWAPTATAGDYFRWGSLLGALRDPPILAFRFKLDILVWQTYAGAVTEDWFNVTPGKYCGLILLVDMRTGELLSIMNDGYLQSYRVGATAGVGMRHLARSDSTSMGVLGSGSMARTYAMAACAERPIQRIKVFSPTPKNREAYARQMSDMLNLPVEPAASAAEAMVGADICATCTDSRVPIYSSEWLAPGVHLVNVRPDETDDETFHKADLVVSTTNLSFTEYLIGTEAERNRRPMDPAYRRRYKPTNFPTLPDVVAGKTPGRTSSHQITFHHNLSAGLQFAAVGYLVYCYAKKNKLGRDLPLDWFQQDIRN